MLTIVTRQEALALGKGRYFTGKPCLRGHLSERWTKWRGCIECMQGEIEDRYRARAKARGIDLKALSIERTRRYDKRHPDRRRAISKAWRERNKGKVAACNARWDKANPERRCALVQKRKAQKLQATPVWANIAEIEQVYKERPKGMQVDYIVPLISPVVCGLHVPWNLQYLTPSENFSKGNRLVL